MNLRPLNHYMLPNISIIVPCRNEATYIKSFITSLVNQDYPKDKLEVVIAEGRSSDQTKNLLLKYTKELPWIRIIDNEKKIVSTALNLAIRQTSHDIVLRMDVHTEYAPDYLRKCVETLLETRFHNVGGPARTKSRTYLQGAIAAAFSSVFAVGNSKSHFEYEGEVESVSYGCWYKETLFKIGLWDESFKKNQDDELNLRLRKAGFRIWQSPAIRSWYYPRESLLGLFKQYFQYGFWKVMVMKKHKTLVSWRHLIPAFFVSILTVSGLMAFFNKFAFGIFLATFFSYLIFITAGSILIAKKSSWTYLPVLPLVLATFHTAYGSGFLIGLLFAYFDKEL